MHCYWVWNHVWLLLCIMFCWIRSSLFSAWSIFQQPAPLSGQCFCVVRCRMLMETSMKDHPSINEIFYCFMTSKVRHVQESVKHGRASLETTRSIAWPGMKAMAGFYWENIELRHHCALLPNTKISVLTPVPVTIGKSWLWHNTMPAMRPPF